MVPKAYLTFQRHRRFFFQYTWPLKVAAFRAGRRLRLGCGQSDGRKAGAVIAVTPYYGAPESLPWFLAYYRRLGVSFFVFLDLSAQRDLAARLGKSADCAVWAPNGFMHPGQAIHALNHLRHKYAHDKWCLSVEPYDFLVFPRSETRSIRDLIDFMESEGRRHIYAIMVDAYGDGPAQGMRFSESKSPFSQLPYFDRFGYQTLSEQALREVPIVGGAQRRTLYLDMPQAAPALNHIPLIRLKWDCYYLASTHTVAPPVCNTPHSAWHSTTTACLMRFALLGDDMALHVAKQAEAGKLRPDNVTTLYPGTEAMAGINLKTKLSGTFSTSQDLLDCGLLNNGQWF